MTEWVYNDKQESNMVVGQWCMKHFGSLCLENKQPQYLRQSANFWKASEKWKKPESL